jgi:hypothetical protein
VNGYMRFLICSSYFAPLCLCSFVPPSSIFRLLSTVFGLLSFVIYILYPKTAWP